VTVARARVFPGTYRDSLLLLTATRAMREGDGVGWAAAVMATPATVDEVASHGVGVDDLPGADANAALLAVCAEDPPAAEGALRRGHAVLFAAEHGAGEGGAPGGPAPRTIAAAAARLAGANVAVVSVPGPYAAMAAHCALTAGLHVLLFSDNVPVADEVALKERASRLGRLVMGPGAGTAVLGGVGLGFANKVGPGPVGVVAAAGTGAQEVMALLDRWGIGVSQVIGVGGRDLSAEVGGRMAADAVRVLDADPGTRVILLVSKPPDPAAATAVIGAATRTPVVAACLGMTSADGTVGGAPLATTLEDACRRVAAVLGVTVPGTGEGLTAAVAQAAGRLDSTRTAVQGFFTGGTLCYEAQVVLTAMLGPVYSNVPLTPDLRVPAPAQAHVCLDLGEEEYTRGRPHPMIDPAARRDVLAGQAFGGGVAAVLLDGVGGYGAHRDPAGGLAGPCADIVAAGAAVVAYVLGTDGDPQGLPRQRQILRDAGALVTQTAAEAARAAAAIACREPRLVRRAPA
jgi:FdrA protein